MDDPSIWSGEGSTGLEVGKGLPENNVCAGELCANRPKASHGNKSCSNGVVCKRCCREAQRKGSPRCRYSGHNKSPFEIGLEEVSPLTSSETATDLLQQQEACSSLLSVIGSSPSPATISLPRSNTYADESHNQGPLELGIRTPSGRNRERSQTPSSFLTNKPFVSNVTSISPYHVSRGLQFSPRKSVVHGVRSETHFHLAWYINVSCLHLFTQGRFENV